MTFTQSCEACGESIAFEYATGDRSGLCWREGCRRRRAARAEAYARRLCDEDEGEEGDEVDGEGAGVRL